MLAILFLAALAASAAGSPSVLLQLHQVHGHRSSGDDLSYTVQVVKGGRTLAPAALILDQYVICSASLIGSAPATTLSVRVGTNINLPFVGKKIKVLTVLVHPEEDVAVLKLQEAVQSKLARPVALVGAKPAPAGSIGQVTDWGWFQRTVEEAVLVLPKYCIAGVDASPSGLCAQTGLRRGGLLLVDDVVVGLATGKGSGRRAGLVRFVDLAEDSVQSFIQAATGAPPTPSTEVPSTPSTATPSTEVPSTPSTATPSTEEPSTPSTATPSTEVPSTPSTPSTTAPSTEAPSTSDAPTSAPPTRKPTPAGTTCKIHDNGGLPTNAPILVAADALAFRDPDDSDAVVLAAGESLRFVCSGDNNGFQLNKNKKVLTAVCEEDDAFRVDGQRVELHQLGCKSQAASAALRNGRCGDNDQFTRIRIGFAVGDEFLTQIDNCFDARTFDAVYSRMNMTPAVAGHESGVKRPQFRPADFYEGINPNTLFKRTNQLAAISKLLGTDASAFVHPNNDDYFLARGHLSAKADYILGAQQSATFYYVNAAPQWQTFNAKNWEKLEDSVRAWVVSSGRSVQVITGIWGTATLPNKDGVETELYLEADKKYLRVPKYYWKVVYDPATKQGAAFVGVNNPYQATNGELQCKDQCARYPWLSWEATNQKAGLSFCCDVNELRKMVTVIPADVDVRSLL